jgi:hypothetical protein
MMTLKTGREQEDPEQGRHETNTPGSQKPKDRTFISLFRDFADKVDIGEKVDARLPNTSYAFRFGRPVMGDTRFEAHLRKLHQETVFGIDDSSMVINLASLHRIELLKLQRQLLEEALNFRYEKSVDITSTSNTSHKYSKLYPEFELCYLLKHKLVQALRDWENIKACAAQGIMNDPFILTTTRLRDSNLIKEEMEKYLEKITSMSDDKQDNYRISQIEEDIQSFGMFGTVRDKAEAYTLFGGSRTEMNRKIKLENFLQRLTMAGVGGAFLIGPMLIMVLKKTLLTTLLTTSICVVAFGFTLAVYLDNPFNVLSGTAAYAAVLVVFVGTSSSNS